MPQADEKWVDTHTTGTDALPYYRLGGFVEPILRDEIHPSALWIGREPTKNRGINWKRAFQIEKVPLSPKVETSTCVEPPENVRN